MTYKYGWRGIKEKEDLVMGKGLNSTKIGKHSLNRLASPSGQSTLSRLDFKIGWILEPADLGK
jgi:hypothetical protein